MNGEKIIQRCGQISELVSHNDSPDKQTRVRVKVRSEKDYNQSFQLTPEEARGLSLGDLVTVTLAFSPEKGGA